MTCDECEKQDKGGPAVSVCKDYLPWRNADPPLAIDECRWYEWQDGSCELTREFGGIAPEAGLCRWMGRPGR